jgi:plastocyanin
VLVTGETGTGKELVARAIHARSAQRNMPMIKVNCAAIPETLLESELFGHVRGAFTGATFTKKGRFALAEGGTIFLDEIGTIALSVQAKLLRVLQDREFEPLGAERTQKVDLRVIAATNRDLRLMVADGRFLEDLFYRLNVIPIEMPPLRDRPEDIPLLVEHFVKRFAERTGKTIDGVDEKAMLELTRYEWPGNVRELENTIERAVVLSTRRCSQPHVWLMSATADAARAAVPSLKLHQNLEWAERETMRRALEQARGVKKDAAELMGISQRALSHYLAKYRIERLITASVSTYADRAAIGREIRDHRDPRRHRPCLMPASALLTDLFKDSVAAAGTALLLVAAAMSHLQDPAAASAPLKSAANGAAVRSLAQDEPRIVEIVAKRFSFEPARVDVTEGERVRLVVKSADGVHGIEIKKFKITKKVPRGGDPVTIEFVASAPGEFPILCSEYCGDGHEDMKGMLVVTAKSAQ